MVGAGKFAGTPSQLISRRTPPKEPFAPAVVPPPRSVRKASRAAVISAAVGPLAERTTCANDEEAVTHTMIHKTTNPQSLGSFISIFSNLTIFSTNLTVMDGFPISLRIGYDFHAAFVNNVLRFN